MSIGALRQLFAIVGVVSLAATPLPSQFDRAELRARRTATLDRLGPGLLLVHAASGYKRWEDAGFHQDPAFLYLTGLKNLQSGIILLDGVHSTTWLFAPSGQRRPDSAVFRGHGRAYVVPGTGSEEELGLDHVVSWDRFAPVIDSLLASTPGTPLYVDGGGQTGRQAGRQSNPTGLAPVANGYVLWRHAIAQRWPSAEIKEAWPILDDVRSIKSASEIAALRRASMTTARAVVAAARAIRPGATQREVEGIAMGAALKAGSDGPSLWPWVRSGPQSSSTVLFDAFMDYENGDRIMRGGEIVRVDLGFDADGYKGDLGRTFPVSGRFTPDQRAALALLNGAYLAGAGVMREGVSRDSVIAASKAYLRAHLPSVGSSVARAAGEQLLNHGSWPLHGLGLDMAEGLPRILRAGNVICFEPAISVGGEDLFVEDTFLITTTGAERLSALLPYEPLALEQLMRGTSHRAP